MICYVSSNFIFICLVFLILTLCTGQPVEHARFSEKCVSVKGKKRKRLTNKIIVDQARIKVRLILFFSIHLYIYFFKWCIAEVDPVWNMKYHVHTAVPRSSVKQSFADYNALLLYSVTRYGARLIGQHAPRPVMQCDSERSKRGRLTNPDDLRGRSWRSKHGRLWK